MINIDDVRDFDAMLKRRIERFQVKLQDIYPSFILGRNQFLLFTKCLKKYVK